MNANRCELLNITYYFHVTGPPGTVEKGKHGLTGGIRIFFGARNPMYASEWLHSFDLNPKRPIFNFLDESQKIAAREARLGATREPLF